MIIGAPWVIQKGGGGGWGGQRERVKYCRGGRMSVRKQEKAMRPPLHRLPWRQSGWKAVAVLQDL